jgi:molybdopterin molybdotransferase
LAPGQIHDSNSIALAAQARLVGADVRLLGIAPDSLDEVTAMLRDALSWADAVVVSGGVSVGAHDVVKAAFESLGRLHLWRVAVQPGKPVAHARAPRTGLSDALLFGLPGNPVSSFVTFELFVRPVLRRLAGHADPVARPRARARLGSAVTKSPNRRAFLRVRLERDTESTGGLVAQLAGGQGSHVLSALASAEALAVIPEDVPGLPAGAEVEVWPLDTETGHGGRPS